jgi:hypothetical protein
LEEGRVGLEQEDMEEILGREIEKGRRERMWEG